jgi:hypothetical protein
MVFSWMFDGDYPLLKPMQVRERARASEPPLR